MISQTTLFYSSLAYFVLFMISVAALVILKVKRDKRRPPFGFKLLRGPGESLRRKLADHDSYVFLKLVGAAMVPVLIANPFLIVLAKVAPKTSLNLGLWMTGTVLMLSLVPFGYWAVQHLLRYRDYRLGYLGERAVGESLAELTTPLYRVFHDIPATGAKKDFNLDHVVVGPNGLFLIETKARRKGGVRPGMKDHVVTFDGSKLIWPWGEDRCGLDQAQSEAQWLTEFIGKLTGLNVIAEPILVFPGWYVTERRTKDLRVVNQKKRLPSHSKFGEDGALGTRGRPHFTSARTALPRRRRLTFIDDLICRSANIPIKAVHIC